MEMVEPASYHLDIPISWKTHNVFHVGLLSRTKEDTIPGRVAEPQGPIRIQEQELWAINQILNSCGSGENYS